MKKKYTFLLVFTTLITSFISVYIGRIYFPENFHPESTSFCENYIVFTSFLSSIVILIWACSIIVNNIIKKFR